MGTPEKNSSNQFDKKFKQPIRKEVQAPERSSSSECEKGTNNQVEKHRNQKRTNVQATTPIEKPAPVPKGVDEKNVGTPEKVQATISKKKHEQSTRKEAQAINSRSSSRPKRSPRAHPQKELNKTIGHPRKFKQPSRKEVRATKSKKPSAHPKRSCFI